MLLLLQLLLLLALLLVLPLQGILGPRLDWTTPQTATPSVTRRACIPFFYFPRSRARFSLPLSRLSDTLQLYIALNTFAAAAPNAASTAVSISGSRLDGLLTSTPSKRHGQLQPQLQSSCLATNPFLCSFPFPSPIPVCALSSSPFSLAPLPSSNLCAVRVSADHGALLPSPRSFQLPILQQYICRVVVRSSRRVGECKKGTGGGGGCTRYHARP